MNKPAKIVIALLCIALIVLAVVAINYNNDLNNQWYAQLADMRADLEALTASEEAAVSAWEEGAADSWVCPPLQAARERTRREERIMDAVFFIIFDSLL